MITDLYLSLIKQNKISYIASQEFALLKIQNYITHFLKNKIIAKIVRLFKKHKKTLNSIYIYGGVGQGKTMLCDIIANYFDKNKCLSIHFSNFLTILQTHSSNMELANFDIIIIDEFEILDIVAAVLVKDFLFKYQSKLFIFTSNKNPDELYKNGIQRSVFIPIIEALKKELVINLNIGSDYRKEKEKQIFVNNNESEEFMYGAFLVAVKTKIKPTNLNINNRIVSFTRTSQNNLYVNSDEIFNKPFGTNDYNVICKHFSNIFIGGFYEPNINELDIVRRIVWFIDSSYTHKTKLHCGFTFDFHNLQKFEKIIPEITRTISRLKEL